MVVVVEEVTLELAEMALERCVPFVAYVRASVPFRVPFRTSFRESERLHSAENSNYDRTTFSK